MKRSFDYVPCEVNFVLNLRSGFRLTMAQPDSKGLPDIID
jgi:hypothetical protein